MDLSKLILTGRCSHNFVDLSEADLLKNSASVAVLSEADLNRHWITYFYQKWTLTNDGSRIFAYQKWTLRKSGSHLFVYQNWTLTKSGSHMYCCGLMKIYLNRTRLTYVCGFTRSGFFEKMAQVSQLYQKRCLTNMASRMFYQIWTLTNSGSRISAYQKWTLTKSGSHSFVY